MTRRGAILLAGMVAGTAAMAKDLPRGRAEHRPTGCEAFGPGFVKLEGSDSCVKVSGGMRVESDVMSSGSSLVPGTARR